MLKLYLNNNDLYIRTKNPSFERMPIKKTADRRFASDFHTFKCILFFLSLLYIQEVLVFN